MLRYMLDVEYVRSRFWVVLGTHCGNVMALPNRFHYYFSIGVYGHAEGERSSYFVTREIQLTVYENAR